MRNDDWMTKQKLPIGIEDFKEIRTDGYYYVDKTNLIKELLIKRGKVNLFTRPRRFGKSLNMSMLKHFFEIGCDKTIFEGLNITGERELCESYMGKYPVVSVSLKDVDGLNFASAFDSLRRIIVVEAMRFSFLEESSKLDVAEKEEYKALLKREHGELAMSADTLKASLQTLTKLLEKHYGCQVILLIDEYDVPLDKSFHAGYYNEMIDLIRNMLSKVLKSNTSLKFSVLTGCLRISKESIFTGLNNLKVFSIMDVQFDEYFGFTDDEVKEMLEYYDLLDKFDMVKEWYDGYRFGNVSVYCPWDVIMYGYDLRTDSDMKPKAYWINTSSNSIVKRFIYRASKSTQKEIEKLIAGEAIWKEIHQDLTYNELDKTIDHLWSVLFMTGYLTQMEKKDDGKYLISIPNKEIRQIFIRQVKEWFSEITVVDMSSIHMFANAFKTGDVETIENMFHAYLKKAISIRDTSVAKPKKENFYHGILLGLFAPMGDWLISSNAESGDGYSDILIETEDETGIIIEVKYGEKGKLDEACMEALQQIEDRKYVEKLEDDGMEKILKYGIGCYKKRCKVILAG